MSHRALLAAAGAQGKTFVEDVFSAYPYIGTSPTAQTITNGIDLANKGGLVWVKSRDQATNNVLVDTVRGAHVAQFTNLTTIDYNPGSFDITGFTSSGFTLGTDSQGGNAVNSLHASWTFRRAPKFFDVVTWTGDGTTNRQIPHTLGLAPGMVTVKRRDASPSDWAVWHRSATGDLYLNQTAAQTGSFTQITAASATTFSVSGNANINGATYVAYLWAHDPDTVNGIVQCGSFTTDASGKATVNLGWEPQYVLMRAANLTDQWRTVDSSRGFPAAPATTTAVLYPNQASPESAAGFLFAPSSTSFALDSLAASQTFIYLAIRRGPMRTPTSGASVYNAIARTGTGAAATLSGVGFPTDFFLSGNRTATDGNVVFDRLRGAGNSLVPRSTNAEGSSTDSVVGFDVMDGLRVGADASNFVVNFSSRTYIQYHFRRAPGFFDIVCDAGTGAAHTIAHNLTVAPELVLRKGRSGATQWEVWHSALANTQKLVLNSNAAAVTDATAWNSTSPTASSFTVGTDANVNTNAATYVSYLFASCPGVSKIGSYSGSASDVTVNCGFAAGARFVLAKRIDSTGDWVVVDTVRGIVVGADKSLALNTTAAEVTTADIVDPASVGFIAKAGSIMNPAAGATMIYLAIA